MIELENIRRLCTDEVYSSHSWFVMDVFNDYIMDIIKEDPGFICNIEHPTEAMQRLAIKLCPGYIKNIRNPPEDLVIKEIKKNKNLIHRMIYNDGFTGIPWSFTQPICWAILKTHGAVWINTIPNPTEEMKLYAVKHNPYCIRSMRDPSEEIQLAAIIYIKVFRSIHNPTEKVTLKAISKWPHIISNIENPCEEFQLAAVKADKESIRFIKNPTEAVKVASMNFIQRMLYKIIH